MKDSLVIIPTYNEKENVGAIVEATLGLAPHFDVLIVDDGSPDGTAVLVKELQQTYPERLYLIERSGKLGLGTAYITGFRWGIEQGRYAMLFEMDADFSHSPKDLLRLRNTCLNGSDVVIGSRYCKGGAVENWPFNRKLLSYGASLYVRIVLGLKVKDPTSGFKCYNVKVLKTIDLDKIDYVGYAFQIAMKYITSKHGFKLEEIPITFKDREKGVSKMSTAIFKEAVVGVWRMRSLKI